jgi:predicted porin
MRKKLGISVAMLLGVAGAAQAADLPTSKPAPPPPPPTMASCASVSDFFLTACPLSYYGITIYGTVDMGVGWESHGTTFNRYIVTGVEEFIQKNSNKAQWLATPNGLSQSNIGIKGKEEFYPGWSFVFDLNMGFDPYSLQIANGPRSLVENNGLPLTAQSSNADSSRAGQFYNGAGFAGISSTTFGTLTFGRQNSLTLDGVNAYDPMGGSYAFSPIGWSGATAGVGDTEDTRYSTAFKYRVEYGGFRFGALGQVGGYDLNNASTGAYEFQLGADYGVGPGKLSFDAIWSQVYDAVSSAALSTTALALKYPGQLAATISDDQSLMLLTKYVWGPMKFYGGYEHILFSNPSTPQTTFNNIGGYTISAANITNTAYDANNKVLQIFWTGGRYAFTDDLDAGVAYYHYDQPAFGAPASCGISSSSSSHCHGAMNAGSFDVDYHFLKKFDVYAGVMYSEVEGGLSNGYLHNTNWAPTAGLRFRF